MICCAKLGLRKVNNMNTNNQKRAHRTPVYRRPAVIITFIAILIIVASIVLIIFMNLDHPETNNADQTADNSSSATSSNRTTSSTSTSAPEDDGWESKAPQYEGENVNTNHELSGTILRKEADSNARTLTVYAMIDQYFNEPGSCIFLLKKADNVVYRTEVKAEADITTSICDPITISTSQIDPGTYEIEIQLSGNNKTGIIKEEIEL